MSIGANSRSSFIQVAKQTGIDIVNEDATIVWTGPKGGNIKPVGPLAGKKIGCMVASEFSDFQAYYMASYIGEFGGTLEFIKVDTATWKFTRPTVASKGVEGMWGLTVGPIPVMGGDKANISKSIGEVNPGDYDGLIILGGHSGDIMSTEKAALDFMTASYQKGAVLGGIGGGIIPIISTGLMKDRECTGSEQVSFMLKKIGRFSDAPCVVDDRIITARDTVDTALFFYTFCRQFDPDFVDNRKEVLAGKTMLFIVGWDFEDFEIAVPVLEFMYRGAGIIIGTFTGSMRARPPLLGLDVIQGNFGMSVPLQEVPESAYTIKKLSEISMDEFDGLLIPGAFCPWNMIEVGAPLEFIKKADTAGKILSYMCHGPIAVAAADLVQGKKITGWLASKDAVTAMGGIFRPELAAAIDGNHVSGRTPPEVPEFIDAITEALLRP